MDSEQVLIDRIQQRKKEFTQWHLNNPAIWAAFERFALEAAESNRATYSHWAVMNRVRWHTSIETTGKEFKISNNHIAFYARIFCGTYPQYRNFFNFKPLKEERLLRYLRQQKET